MGKVLKIGIIIEVTVILIIGLISTFYFKQLYKDGSYWAFDVVNTASWHFDQPFYRFFTGLLQTLSVIAARMGSSVFTTVWFFCLGYFIYPFVGLFLAFKILPENKRNFILIAVASFFLCIIPNWAFAISTVNEVIVLGWILLAYIISRDKPNALVIGFVSTLIFFSYELGPFFYLTAAYYMFREKKLSKGPCIILFIFSLLQTLNVLYNIVPNESHKHFLFSLSKLGFNPYLWLLFPFLTLFTLKKLHWAQIIITISIVVWVIFYAQNLFEGHWDQAYFNRIWAIPAACLLFILGYELIEVREPKLVFLFSITIFFTAIPSLKLEWQTLQDQKAYHTFISNKVLENNGCFISSQKDLELLLGGSGYHWSTPHLSILLNDSLEPKSILYTNQSSDKIAAQKEYCKLNAGQIQANQKNIVFSIARNQRFNFKALFHD